MKNKLITNDNLINYHALRKMIDYKSYFVFSNNFFVYLINLDKKLQDHGWKIHISTEFKNCKKILKKVLHYSLNNKINIKWINSKAQIEKNLSKNEDRTLSGKFITIYTYDLLNFKKIIFDLHIILKKFKGPSVLTDKKYLDSTCIFYRYGFFHYPEKQYYKINNKKWFDLQFPYFNKPNFVDDPFEDLQQNKKNDKKVNFFLHNNKYEVISALHFSNFGGVYKVKNKNGNFFIVKEARPFLGTMKFDNPYYLLKNEKNFLIYLQKFNFIPKYIEDFHQEGHYFIVKNFIEGKTLYELHHRILINFEDINNVDEISKKIFLLETICNNIIFIVDSFHKKNVLINDLNLSNFLINDENKIFFIDLEYSNKKDSNFKYFSNLDYKNKSLKFNDFFKYEKIKLAYFLIDLIMGCSHLLNHDSSGEKIFHFFLKVFNVYNLSNLLKNKIINLLGPQYKKIKNTNEYLKKIDNNFFSKKNIFKQINIIEMLIKYKNKFETYSDKWIFYKFINQKYFFKKDFFHDVRFYIEISKKNNKNIDFFMIFLIIYEKKMILNINEYTFLKSQIIKEKNKLLKSMHLILLEMFYKNFNVSYIKKEILKILMNNVFKDKKNYYVKYKNILIPNFYYGNAIFIWILLIYFDKFKDRIFNLWIYRLANSLNNFISFKIGFYNGTTGYLYLFLNLYLKFKEKLFLNILKNKLWIISNSLHCDDNFNYGYNDSKGLLNSDISEGYFGILFVLKKVFNFLDILNFEEK